MSKPPRLYVESGLAEGAAVPLAGDQAHYLLNVMRRSDGDPVVLFNGRDGEWQGAIRKTGKRTAEVDLAEKLRAQTAPPDIDYCFAPIKRARLDFIAQKATELGAARLHPIVTRFTMAERVKTERLRANAVEAAEQCGILWVPEIAEPVAFDRWLADRDPSRTLIFCDEAAPVANPIEALKAAPDGLFAVLIGPEGGFSPDERDLLLRGDNVIAISLGPRVMRADTAGIAAMALLQAVKGDWR
jgi:16S rRNA (uracil1498-N3)-methyltransferase